MTVDRTEHARTRAFERYGFVPNFGEMLERISRHEGKLIALCEEGRLIYDVPVQHVTMRAVVDASRSYVVTVLPLPRRRRR